MIDICLLGSGGMMPLPNRWLTAMLLRYKGKMILVDCGEGTQIAMKLAGWGFKSIDAVCLTHYHADHVAGLPGFLLTLGNSGREKPLTICGPAGVDEVVKGLTVIAPELPFEIETRVLSQDQEDGFDLDDVRISSLPVDHTIPCLSYRFDVRRAPKFDAKKARQRQIPISMWSRLQKGETLVLKGKTYTPDMVLGAARKGIRVGYCTDTRPTASMADFFKASDLLVCEGMYGDEEKLPKAVENKHMLFSEAAKIAAAAGAGTLWLTHYSPSMKSPEEHLEQTRLIFQETYLGSDLLTKTLVF